MSCPLLFRCGATGLTTVTRRIIITVKFTMRGSLTILACLLYFVSKANVNVLDVVHFSSELRWTSPKIAVQSSAEGLRFIIIAGEPHMWWCSTKRVVRNLRRATMSEVDWVYTRIKWFSVGILTVKCARRWIPKMYYKYFAYSVGPNGEIR